MAGSLIKIDEEIVTSAVASVSLLGIDSTYDVYQVVLSNIATDTDNVFLETRVTVSGTPDTSANYDIAYKKFNAISSFTNGFQTNLTGMLYTPFDRLGTAGNENGNAIMYLFNFNNASEYSFLTVESTMRDRGATLVGEQGGATNTVQQACDGLNFDMSSGNIDTGSKFTLYGLKK